MQYPENGVSMTMESDVVSDINGVKVTIPSNTGINRECGSCTGCCRVFAVSELDKPAGTDCQYMISDGCGIYSKRPGVCRGFVCLWIRDHRGYLEECERPDRVGLILTASKIVSNQKQSVRIVEIYPGAAKKPEGQNLIHRFSRYVPVELVKAAEISDPRIPLVDVRVSGLTMGSSGIAKVTTPSTRR